jgi:rhodanese-related sulfurtransferase
MNLTAAFPEAGRVVLLSVLLALTYNYFSPRGLPLLYEPKQIGWLEDQSAATDSSEPLLIDINQAERIFREGNAIFIDARHEEEFILGHIEGAVCIPMDDVEKNPGRLAAIPKNALIVTYCGGEDCALSTDLGFKLSSLGYTNVRIFFAGWLEWQKNQLPIGIGPSEGHLP